MTQIYYKVLFFSLLSVVALIFSPVVGFVYICDLEDVFVSWRYSLGFSPLD